MTSPPYTWTFFAGVTARELCNYFFEEEFRMEWETTVEQVWSLSSFKVTNF